MREVVIKREALLQKLHENRDRHRAVFLEATEGFRVKAIALLEQALSDAKAGRRVRASYRLQQPVDQTREYDRTILMLEMSVDDTVKLTSQEFEAYVMDRWAWKHQFLLANSAYSVSAATEARDTGVGEPDED